jgi:tripartite-type tricarboxylate transporter receptor subunit TctC
MFQQVKSGLLKPLAVLTPQRMTSLPDLPTAIEAGYPQLTVNAWFGLFVPVGTPRAVVQRIHADTSEVLRGKDVQDKLAGMGAEPMVMGLEGFEEMVSSDIRKWGKVTRDSGATAE